MKAHLETNRRGRTMYITREITLQETQGLKTFIITVLAICLTIIAVGYTVKSQRRISVLEAENVRLRNTVFTLLNEQDQIEIQYNSTITKLESNIENSNDVIDTLSEEVELLISDNRNLAKQYDEVLSEYNKLSLREELYDKYEYVVTYGGERTDVTYDQIKFGEELMVEKNYDPNILFSIIMVESRGKEAAKNKKSSATGYGQFIKGTGKYVYEALLGNGEGTYNHPVTAIDGDTNIEMMVTYLDHLFTKTNNNFTKSISIYSGRGSVGTKLYISWMNGFTRINKVKLL